MVRKSKILIRAVFLVVFSGVFAVAIGQKTSASFDLDKQVVTQKKMPEAINTASYSESVPLVDATERKLIFNRYAEGKNYILYCEKVDGYWSEPKDITSFFSDSHDMYAVDISADGQMLLLTSMEKSANIYYAVLEGEEWTEPELVEPLKSRSKEGFATISYDERMLVFTSDRKGGFGGMDLYYVTRQDNGSWSEPINMGQAVNSPANEATPSIHTDGTTLFFSSDRAGGFGGFDMYVCQLVPQDSTWTQASLLSEKINSKEDDLCFRMSVNKERAYWAAGKAPNGLDIHWAEVQQKNTMPSHVVYTGKVVLSDDGPPGIVNLTISDAHTKEVIGEYRPNSLNGEYTYILEPDKKYNILLTAPGYLGYTHDFVVPRDSAFTFTRRSITLDQIKFYNPPLKVRDGRKVAEIQNVLFGLNEFDVTDYNKNLNKLADHLMANSGCVIEIGGHADAKGNASYNQRLSRKRAVQVADYLQKKGVRKSSFVIRDYGQSQPIAINENEDTQRYNRRVEFKVLKQGDVFLDVKQVDIPESYKIPKKWNPKVRRRKLN